MLLVKKRCRRGFLQRLGWVPQKLYHLDAPIVWVHAVSLGEVLTIVPFMKLLHDQYPNIRFVVSTVTETGREAVEQRLTGIAEHCYLPLDFPWAVAAYIRTLNPLAFLVVETELWPNLLWSLRRYHVPALLINGRISSRSYRGYILVRSLIASMLSGMALCLMQSDRDVKRIKQLGANPTRVFRTGNMKFDQDLGKESTDIPSLSFSSLGLVDGEKLIIGGSTHPEEEDALLHAFACLQRDHPSTVLLLAPRHIERVDRVEQAILRHGFIPVRRSMLRERQAISAIPQEPRVIVLDTRGELAWVYRFGCVAFVGGSLVPVGGHNLLEPAQWGTPVLFGPFVDHCSEVASLLIQTGGGIQVQNRNELKAQIIHVLQNPSWAHEVGEAARRMVLMNKGVTKRNVALVTAVLEGKPPIPFRESSIPGGCVSDERL